VWVCIFRYPVCKAHAPCCTVICGLPSSYHILPHYLTNGTIFGGGGGLLYIKCVFRFSLQSLSETFLKLRRIRRDIVINVHTSSQKSPLFLLGCNETLIFSIDFEKYSNSWKFGQLEPSYSMRAGGWTDTTLSLSATLRTRVNWANIRCREPSVQVSALTCFLSLATIGDPEVAFCCISITTRW
jgi:hypothetical protein